MQLASKPSSDNLDMYLKLMEKERQRQRQRLIRISVLVGGAICLLAITLGITLWGGSSEDAKGNLTYLMFQKEYLPHDQIFSYLVKPQHAVVILEGDGQNADTITNPMEYQAWLDKNPMAMGMGGVAVTTSLMDTASDARPDIQTSPIGLVLRGTLVAEQALTFVVSGYRSDFNYQLDLGNGRIRDINQRFTYVYRESGTFTVRLTASDGEGNSRTIQRRIDISLPPSPDERIASQDEEIPNLTEQTLVITDEEDPFPMTLIQESEPEELAFASLEGGSLRSEATLEAEENTEAEATTEAPTAAPASEPVNLDLANHIFVATEVPPSFPGGYVAMRRFLTRNINFPEEAADNNVSGTVTVRFVVNKDGSLSDPSIINKLGYGCEDEVMRVLGKMPRWKAGKIGGKPVRSYYVLPVSFEIR